MIYPAKKTIKLIDDLIKKDQGQSYKEQLKNVLPHITDAYRADSFPFRSHLGASIIGRDCARQIWYSFRWTSLPQFEGRILRLFNRGHLEEGRFIALLLMAGIQVYQQDKDGKQFRISDACGHFGGSGDGIAIGVSDAPAGTQVLLEFKTHNDKSFNNLKKQGVEASKFEHFVQCQIYLRKMGLSVALYLAVNKNDDHLYGEMLPINTQIADEYIQRGQNLIWMEQPPKRINESPGWYKCKWCDAYNVCHEKQPPFKSCRSCVHGIPTKRGTWSCINDEFMNKSDFNDLTTKQQLSHCGQYKRWF